VTKNFLRTKSKHRSINNAESDLRHCLESQVPDSKRCAPIVSGVSCPKPSNIRKAYYSYSSCRCGNDPRLGFPERRIFHVLITNVIGFLYERVSHFLATTQVFKVIFWSGAILCIMFELQVISFAEIVFPIQILYFQLSSVTVGFKNGRIL
jgi:hypothetical protein